LTVVLITVSENPPACGFVKPDWDEVGPLRDHVAADEVAEE
jgi:hypothetical protein